MLSVIIPVYRVEKYLPRCLDSVLVQTYKDMQIILVDDGSDDGCPAICDEYAAKDSRIQVIHKENGGIGSTRNAGLAVAKGEYITFVDSDDYIHPKMYELFVALLDENKNADIVMCPYEKIPENDENAQERYEISLEDCKYMEHMEICKEMFADEYESYIVTWNKVYRKELLENMIFPVGRFHEDIFTTYHFLYDAKGMFLFEKPMYYYRQRAGSAMSKFNEKGVSDDVDAMIERIDFFSTKEDDAYAACASRNIEHLVFHYKDARKNGATDLADRIRSEFLREWKAVKKNKKLSIPKERRVYFNSFQKSYHWMEFYMPIYWKCMSLKRKLTK